MIIAGTGSQPYQVVGSLLSGLTEPRTARMYLHVGGLRIYMPPPITVAVPATWDRTPAGEER